jgi:hypothetical protein
MLKLMLVLSLPFTLIVPIGFCYVTIVSLKTGELFKDIRKRPSTIVIWAFLGVVAWFSFHCFLYILSEKLFDWDWFDRFGRLRIISGMWI